MGAYAIVRALNSTNVPPLGATQIWGKSYVEKILKSRAVIGEFQPHRKNDGKRTPVGEMVSRYFPPIIEEELFYRVQTARSGRKVGGGRRGDGVPNLFTHVARCFYCKSPMHYIDKGEGPRGGKYIRCSNSIAAGDCTAGSWKYIDFEKSFLTFSKEIDLSSISKASAKQQEYTVTLDGIVTSEEKKASLEAQLDGLSSTAAYLEQANARANLAKKIGLVQKQIDIEANKIIALNAQLSSSGMSDEISDIEHGELVALFQGPPETSGVELRQKLQKKIRGIIKSLLLATDGMQKSKSSDYVGTHNTKTDYQRLIAELKTKYLGNNPSLDVTNARTLNREKDVHHIVSGHKLVAELQNKYLGNNPFFDVIYVGDIERRVAVEGDDPTKLKVLIEDDAATVNLK